MEAVAGSIKPGDHVALIYKTRHEQLHWVCNYVREGLERKERCLYIAHDNSVPTVLASIASVGVDTEAAQRAGALRIVTREQSYLRFGIFEPARMIEDLKAEVTAALRDGFT